jgi:hypothetical protein
MSCKCLERSIAWLNRCRRLAKENLNRMALAFLRIASIRLMIRKALQSGLKGPDKL